MPLCDNCEFKNTRFPTYISLDNNDIKIIESEQEELNNNIYETIKCWYCKNIILKNKK
jgi:hypothetical protein